MFQDSQGKMWFGTSDGLNMFDGYSFKCYKTNPDKSSGLENYRVDKITEDKLGFLWVITYDGFVYRFNPATEKFLKVPQCNPEFSDKVIKFRNIYTFDDGSVWITSQDEGCFKITEKSESDKILVEQYAKGNDYLTSNSVNMIFRDSAKNYWILTSNGINILKPSEKKPVKLFQGKDGGGFKSVIETNKHVWFGGEHGNIRTYDVVKQTFDGIYQCGNSDIINLEKCDNQFLYVLAENDGLFLLDTKKNQIQALTSSQLPKNNIYYSCYVDRNKNVWVESEKNQVLYFDSKKGKFITYQTQNYESSLFAPGANYFILEDKTGNIWIQPRHGSFCRYNPQSDRIEMFYNDLNSPEKRFSNLVHSAFSDRQGNLWLCPFSHGIEKVTFCQSPFNFIKPSEKETNSAINEIRAIYQDKENNIWVAAKNGDITLYNSSFHKLGRLGANGQMNSTPFKALVYSIYGDSKGNIWLGSKKNGLYKLSRNGAGNHFSYKIQHYEFNANDIYSLSSNNVYYIVEDHLKRIWVCTFGGGINLIEENGNGIRFISHRNLLHNFPADQCLRTRFMAEDKYHHIIVGTTGGLVVFNADNSKPEEIGFKKLNHIQGKTGSLSGNDIFWILPSTNGNIYFAVFGGGINVLKSGRDAFDNPEFSTFQTDNGAPSNIINSLLEDTKGNIWFTTENEIARLKPSSQSFDVYTPHNESNYLFNEACAYRTNTGQILFGSTEGFVLFDPRQIVKSSFIPPIHFSDLYLFNKKVETGAENSPLKQVIDQTEELTLNHKQNIFSISFSALDYNNPQSIQYAYKLDGFETDWNYVRGQRVATYTNIPKGKYVFRVKSTNADGAWVNNERSIVIIRKPSFWESAWGYLFYLILFIGLAGLTVYVLYTIFRLRTNVEVEHRMTNMKLRFFTDISHELRTPLTLIASPVENILNHEPLSESARDQLTVVQHNTERMLRLINQILDFRKIQNNKMKLTIELIQPGEFLKEISYNFTKMAEEKKINFSITDETNHVKIWADKDKLEKIFFNLLSNAFKFTQAGNKVEVHIFDDQQSVSVSVKDSGTGITRDRIKLLFNRFESFTGTNVSFQQGTGIGLSLTKELVELHHATIGVESEPGKGSEFTVSFKKGNAHFAEDDELVSYQETPDETLQEVVEEDLKNPVETDNTVNTEQKTILIVEDNDELRLFLKTVLSSKYNILEAENGTKGLEIAGSEIPDIIISDVMMPEMNGMEMTRAIKDDIRISHIPVVLLTAKTDMENKLEALQYGVDDYITKPFSSAYLEARIENLLNLRKKLQELYRASLTTGVFAPSRPHVVSQDDVFMQKIITFIENNIENPELTVKDIADHVAFSRSVFFNKIKSLTGLSPIEFLREIRIQRAAQWIETGEYSFSEISYMVGFSDPSYFSKSFKEKFGISPKKYKENCKKPD